MEITEMRIAIVHDWLITFGGAERALKQILSLFPNAHVYTLLDLLSGEDKKWFSGVQIHTSFLQRLPISRRSYRNWLPLMPYAIEQFDLKEYDLVISSSFAVAKGVITGPDQLHISYIYSPARYAWDLQGQYGQGGRALSKLKTAIMRIYFHHFRIWDVTSSARVDKFVSISKYISRRVKKCYNRDSSVVYPPVDVKKFELYDGPRKDYYLSVSRLVPYKRVDLIVEAFHKLPDKRLILVGEGPEFESIKAGAPANVLLAGRLKDAEVVSLMQEAKAFVFASEEDFGIAPVEAQACGTPVIAFRKGGASETVNDVSSSKPTGVLFDSQSADSIAQAILKMESIYHIFRPAYCREKALAFSEEAFSTQFLSMCNEYVKSVNEGGK